MIRYKIDVLKKLRESGYTMGMIKSENLLSQSTIQDLRKGRMVGTLATLDKLCCMLDMQPGDIIECWQKPKTTIVYEVVKNTGEYGWREKKNIHTGCTFEQDSYCPEVLEKHHKKEDALDALKKYSSDIRKMSGAAGPLYLVTEYAVQETLYDEDGDELQTTDIWEFSELPELDF